MDGNHILFKNTLKFLGVTFNKHLRWVDHAKSMRDKVLSKGMELRRLTRENRGLAPLVTKRLYKAGFERIICYAASVWWRQENDSLTHKILSSAQRPFALAICRGYNTLSTDAALVLSGLVPINNILSFESKRAELIRPGSLVWILIPPQNSIINSGKTVSFHWVKAHVGLEGNEMADSLARFTFKYPAPYVSIPTPKSWFKYSARKKAISDWQTSWDASLKGRSLYNWIKFVMVDRIYSSSALNSILTGHGPFSNYFQRFKIKNPSPCRCGYANPDSDHFLLACPLLDSSRPRCLKRLNPNKPHLLSDHRKALLSEHSEIAVAFSKDLYPLLTIKHFHRNIRKVHQHYYHH
ncbi:hypothetical protein LAZ67_19002236 [Cordylochernes scorpioides]|uniref:RNase H type-1 domain-containing protein n=1 Tax=Cordylochernes scorpioides TaxID=51811 RepID=A0ABY6LK23_9ARAC|nr:hypothetical protein LAZ67_19002236 [Cordylochernes scorpioides]